MVVTYIIMFFIGYLLFINIEPYKTGCDNLNKQYKMQLLDDNKLIEPTLGLTKTCILFDSNSEEIYINNTDKIKSNLYKLIHDPSNKLFLGECPRSKVDIYNKHNIYNCGDFLMDNYILEYNPNLKPYIFTHSE